MPLIKTKFRGRCTVCGETVEPGSDAYFNAGKLICTGCSEFVQLAKGADAVGPVASALQFRGTSMEVVRQLRSVAQRMVANLKAATREAEALSLGLQQVEDQQKSGGQK